MANRVYFVFPFGIINTHAFLALCTREGHAGGACGEHVTRIIREPFEIYGCCCKTEFLWSDSFRTEQIIVINNYTFNTK